MELDNDLAALIRQTLKLPEKVDINEVGLGITAEWTSLLHIKLILLIENKFNVKVPSKKIGEATDFKSLQLLLKELTN